VSLNTYDFLRWREENKLKGEGINDKGKFKMNNETYYCIASVLDLCSFNFNAVIETERAKMNKEYEQIVSTLQQYVN
jgi:hypothetical protein